MASTLDTNPLTVTGAIVAVGAVSVGAAVEAASAEGAASVDNGALGADAACGTTAAASPTDVEVNDLANIVDDGADGDDSDPGFCVAGFDEDGLRTEGVLFELLGGVGV
jgi:hypothetical protein